MVVAFVTDAIYPYNKGGKEVRIYEVTTRLSRMGHQVHIYCMKWWDGPDDRIENGVQLHAISKLYPLYSGERRSIKEGVLFGLSCFKLISKRFDIVDVDHMPYFPLYSMWLVCLLRRKPMLATWHEVWGRKYWVEYMGLAGNMAALIERVSIHLPKTIISVSKHTTQRLRSELSYGGKIELLQNGIDYIGIQMTKTSKEASDIVYAGRLLKHKNLDMLIKSVYRLKSNGQSVKCLIIGDGPERNRLIKLTDKLGVADDVIFQKFYDNRSELYSHLKASRVFALPSSREGFGIVALEANACSIPVVTNAVPDNAAKDFVKHGSNGFHFKNNIKSLTDELNIALLKSASVSNTCLDFAKEFDWNEVAVDYARVYTQ